MPAQWTGDVVGIAHNHRISMQELADAVGWHSKYLSAVLNGRRVPPGAEEKVRAALDALVKARAEDDCEGHEGHI